MKIKYISFLLIINPYIFKASQNQDSTLNYPGLPSINISIHNGSETIATQQNKQQADHFSTQNTGVSTKLIPEPNFKKQLYEYYEQQSKIFNETSTDVVTWVKNNKFKTVGIGLLIFYSYISYQIYQADLIINDHNSWSNWHNSKSIEDLFETPHHKLESDLLFTIQTKYVHSINPTDFIYSLVQSSISLNAEIKIVQDQISRYAWIKTCQCMPLFFIETDDLKALEEKNRKLAFIKHLFSSWCATYKIDKNS